MNFYKEGNKWLIGNSYYSRDFGWKLKYTNDDVHITDNLGNVVIYNPVTAINKNSLGDKYTTILEFDAVASQFFKGTEDFLTEKDIEHLATKDELGELEDQIPTKLSDLIDDAGYVKNSELLELIARIEALENANTKG